MSQRVTLDDTALRARLRSYEPVPRPRQYAIQRPQYTVPVAAPISGDIRPPRPKLAQVAQPVQALQPAYKPSARQQQSQPAPVVHAKRQQNSQVLIRPKPVQQTTPATHHFGLKFDRTTMLTAMAVILFITGTGVSFMSFHTNRIAQAQEKKINKQVDQGSRTDHNTDPAAPGTTKPSAQSLANYAVAPDLARYIKIPKLNVYARVLQLDTKSDGTLMSPANVHDAGWYKNSSKPGAPGATLIDGHVSSWTTNGVFYGIKKLVAGDKITIQKGDGTILNYSVVKTITANVDKVDMQSLMLPVTAGKSGLNLITCGGKYDSKTSEFTQRVMVYATLDS